MNDLKVIPYIKTETGWSIPDADMCLLYGMFKQENLIDTMFPFGGIESEVDFIIWFRNKDNAMQVIVDEEGPLMLFWINRQQGRSCYFHFSCLKRSWGVRTKDLFKRAIKYIFDLEYESKKLFDVIIGNLDARNRVAIKHVQKIGAKILGELPYYFQDINTGNYLPATIAYITRKEVGEWEI